MTAEAFASTKDMLAETQQYCLFFFWWEPGNDKQTTYFVFAIKARHKSVSSDNDKITRKEMSKLFSYGSLTNHFIMEEFRRNVNFEEIDNEASAEKNW